MFAAVVSNPVPVMVRVVALTARLLVLEVTVGTDTKVKNVLAALVPPGVVTKTLAVPALPAGVVAVMVESVTEIMVAATPSMVTTVAPEKPDPEMVMLVPPVVGPLVGGNTRYEWDDIKSCVVNTGNIIRGIVGNSNIGGGDAAAAGIINSTANTWSCSIRCNRGICDGNSATGIKKTTAKVCSIA